MVNEAPDFPPIWLYVPGIITILVAVIGRLIVFSYDTASFVVIIGIMLLGFGFFFNVIFALAEIQQASIGVKK